MKAMRLQASIHVYPIRRLAPNERKNLVLINEAPENVLKSLNRHDTPLKKAFPSLEALDCCRADVPTFLPGELLGVGEGSEPDSYVNFVPVILQAQRASLPCRRQPHHLQYWFRLASILVFV